MRIDGKLFEFHQESFTTSTQLGGTIDSTFVTYSGTFWIENPEQVCGFGFHFKYDSSQINGYDGDGQFNDPRDFYKSFEIETLHYYDIDNQKYPAFTFGYRDSLIQLSTFHDIHYQYNVDQSTSNILFEQVKGMYHPDGLFINGTFQCNLYERETGSESQLTDGKFQIFLKAP